MGKAWLKIPLSDYEGHMSSDTVRQLEPLAELFGRALEVCKPKSVAILGVAGGNGLERIDYNVTRIVGIDINPEYLKTVRERHGTLPGLELYCEDLAAQCPGVGAVELVHAALIFEHTGLLRCLGNALSLVLARGKFSVVLQLPSVAEKDVTPTGFATMQSLGTGFALIEVAEFRRAMKDAQFDLIHEERRELPGGKALWMGIFSRSGP